MAVLYRLQKNNNDQSKAYGKYYAKAVMTQTTNMEVLAERIQRNCTAKHSDVLVVLKELVEVMQEELQASHRVKLDGFGSFKIGITGSGSETVKNFSVREHVKSLHVNFTPDVKVEADKSRRKTFLTGCSVAEAPKNAIMAEKEGDDPTGGDDETGGEG